MNIADTKKESKAPWKKKNPRKKSERSTLSTKAKAAARARATRAGRKYPNLIDNMWAASKYK